MSASIDQRIFPYVLDHKPGFFLSWLLYKLFKRASMDENMKEELKRMHREGTVVYAIKYRGQLDYLLYHFNFRRRRLPYPKIAFDLNISLLLPFTQFIKIAISQISYLLRHGRLPSPYGSGFYKKAIQDRTTSLIFLVDPKGFLQRFIHGEKGHLDFLLETQRETEHPIFVVPQLVLYQRSPEKDYTSLTHILFGFKDHPGLVRKIALFLRYHGRAFIDFGPPVNLKEYLKGQPASRPISEMTAEIRQTLIEGIDSQKRVILGPIMKSREQIKEIVLMDQKVKEKIDLIAASEGEGIKQLRRQAEECFEEIAADYNHAYVQLFHRALTWMWKRLFEGFDVDETGLAKVREWARKGTLIYVPSHKSHIDYLVLNYVLHDYHMHIPRIAAGRNLAFWPMGHVFRKSGAFFIRRSFRSAKLYVEVFNRYIKALLEEGHPIEFFIEGGRSRNGKLVLPKTGFLSILLQAHHEGFCKDLIFVPSSITYDRILEEKSYLKEIGGGAKEKESFKQMLGARRFLKKKYGKIYIRFGSPFSLNEYMKPPEPPTHENTRALAFHLVQSINAASIVTPLSLVAVAILTNHRRGFLYGELLQTAETLLEFLKRHGAPLANTLKEPLKAVQETLSLLIGWKVVEFLEDTVGKEEPFYFVEDEKKLELEYYKNCIIHFFIHHAFVAVSLLCGKEELKSLDSIFADCAFLREILGNEFVFDRQKDMRENTGDAIRYFVESSFILDSPQEGGYRITKLGFEKLPIWAGLAKTFLESYWIAAKAVGQAKDGAVGEEEALTRMDYLGKRFYRLGVVEHVGALSRLHFKNAFALFHGNNDEAERGDDTRPDPSERLSQVTQRLYALSHYGQR